MTPESPWYSQLLVTLGLIALRLALAGLVLLIFFWLGGLVRRVISRVVVARKLNPDLNLILQQIAFATALVLGIVTALGTLGVDVTALVAGLGLASFGLGLALKDIISNTLSGILILMYEPFRRTDRISVTGNEGEVTEINLRYTVLDQPTRRILVPNSIILNNPVIVEKPVTTEGAGE